jgi:hypothetical protein
MLVFNELFDKKAFVSISYFGKNLPISIIQCTWRGYRLFSLFCGYY